MKPTSENKNNSMALEAFFTLFNWRDYAAAEKFWSPNYILHSEARGCLITPVG